MATLYIRNIPPDLHAEAKAAAAKARMSLQDWIIKLISEKIEKGA